MREIRPSSSEGGAGFTPLLLPLSRFTEGAGTFLSGWDVANFRADRNVGAPLRARERAFYG